jgi:transposase InsO family protein
MRHFIFFKMCNNCSSEEDKRVRLDRGGAYFSNEFHLFCEEHGNIHERMRLHSPRSNGVAERKNRTLTEMVNVTLDTAGLS